MNRGVLVTAGSVRLQVAHSRRFAVQLSGTDVHDSGTLLTLQLRSGSAPELVDYARLFVNAPAANAGGIELSG